MAEDRITDARRIAQLLASELHGRSDVGLDAVSVTDADPDVEPSTDGTRAYGIRADDDPLGEVFVHPDRARLELRAGLDAAVEAAGERDLRVRPKAVEPPRTIVFVETGAESKRAADVVGAAARNAGD